MKVGDWVILAAYVAAGVSYQRKHKGLSLFDRVFWIVHFEVERMRDRRKEEDDGSR